MLDFEWIVSFLVLGGFVGFIAGLLGVGGGGIFVPVLTSLFLLQNFPADWALHLALGTSMACIVITSISSMFVHNQNGAVAWRLAKVMSVGAIAGTFASTYLVAYLAPIYLAIFFSMFMAITAVNILREKSEKRPAESQIGTVNMLISSTGIGVVSALVSIGGGSLTVPYLVKRGIDIKKAIGTSAAIGLPVSLAGTLGYLVNGGHTELDIPYTIGFVYLPAAILVSVTSFIAAPIGAKTAAKLPKRVLKLLFALLLTILSAKMLWFVIKETIASDHQINAVKTEHLAVGVDC